MREGKPMPRSRRARRPSPANSRGPFRGAGPAAQLDFRVSVGVELLNGNPVVGGLIAHRMIENENLDRNRNHPGS